MNKRIIIVITVNLLTAFFSFSQDNDRKGALLLMGGEATNTYFLTHFAGLVGGLDKKIMLIPTAMDEQLLDSKEDTSLLLRTFIEFGFTDITIAHARNRNYANSKAFNNLLCKADGVWICGGRQWRLAQAYVGTEVEGSLKKILNNGGVIAGTSAGASILSSFLVRGDSLSNVLMIGSFKKGFGLLKNCAVDQHHLARNRQFDMFEILEQHPNLLGLGIEENTGIVIQDNRFRVIGEGYVCVYDGTRWSEERDTIYKLPKDAQQFYFLGGDLEYDLDKRRIVLPEDRVPKAINNKLISHLVGTYQQEESIPLAINLQIEVSVENEELYFTNSWNMNRYKVAFDHANVFYRPNANAVYYFDKDKYGSIKQFKFYQFGSTTWKKVDDVKVGQ